MKFSHHLKVTFDGTSKTYDYWCDETEYLVAKPGSKAVVCVSGQLKIVTVQFKGLCSSFANKPIVQLIDESWYKAWVVNSARKAEIERELAALASETVKQQAYEIVAKKNPKMKALLAELKELKA